MTYVEHIPYDPDYTITAMEIIELVERYRLMQGANEGVGTSQVKLFLGDYAAEYFKAGYDFANSPDSFKGRRHRS